MSVEYVDPDGGPDDQLIWERESRARLLEPTALPDVAGEAPMVSREFDSLVRATRWTALSPRVFPHGTDDVLRELTVAGPFHGAIQVEDFQLVPLLKALGVYRLNGAVAWHTAAPTAAR